MKKDTQHLIRLANRCLEIHDELSQLHRDIKSICGTASDSGERRKANRCVRAGRFIVQSGDRLAKAQQVICETAGKA